MDAAQLSVFSVLVDAYTRRRRRRTARSQTNKKCTLIITLLNNINDNFVYSAFRKRFAWGLDSATNLLSAFYGK